VTLRYKFAPARQSANMQGFAEHAEAFPHVRAHIMPDCVILEAPVQVAGAMVQIIASPARAEMGMRFTGRV
jgi:hypothetical protein